MDKPTLLLTRPRASSERFVSELSQALLDQVDVLISPLIEIVPTDAVVSVPENAGVIFTSSHGVAFAPDGAGRLAFCVGERTAQAARLRGWDVQLVAPDAATLIAQLDPGSVTAPLVHLSGHHRRGQIAAALTAKSIATTQQTLYDQTLCALTTEAKNVIASPIKVIVPLFSPRTAAQFADQMGEARSVHIAALSNAVVDALGDHSFERCEVAYAPTAKDIRQSIEKLVF